ncbi:unnamed protein product [Urochloa decumbens]|uniref:Uncharacterized protein n=1 Tax=Urochloa decumbens TaxID=240449 RepID=A0ABC9AMZ4_9POAL
MKLRHLPPVLFLFVTALSFPSLSVHRHLSLPRPRSPPSSSSHHAAVGDDDALLRRLASVDPGADYLLAEATALLANATLSSTRSPGDAAAQHHHRLLTLRFPSHDSTNATAYRLRVPHDTTLHADDDGAALLAAFRASLRSLLLTRRHIPHDAAAVMRDLPYLLGLRHRRFPACAVVGNSGILLGSGRGAQIDAHDFIIRLNNAPAGGGFTRDVGAKTSLSLAHSTVLRRCATSPSAASAATTPRCAACHPYGRDVPLAIYVSHAAHLLDALVCGNATSPFRLVVTDPRLDALCARIAKYYSLRRFVAETGWPASGWRRDERPPHFHYSSGLQAVVVALGVCDEVSMFGFGKAAGVKPHHYHTGRKKETAVHDYEAEYQFYRDLQTRPEAVPFLDQAVAAGFRLPPVRQYW